MRLITSRLLLSVLVLSLNLSHMSGAALVGNNRKLVAAPGVGPGDFVKISPSPSPNSSTELSTNGTSATPESSVNHKGNGTLTEERCETTPYSCHQNNLTACVQVAGKVPLEASLLVQNGGEETLIVNVSFSPNNSTFTNILLLKSEARKIDVSRILKGNQEIILTSGNESCVIHIGLSVPSRPRPGGNFFMKLPYADQVTPIHLFLFSSVSLLVIAGIWACCKSETSQRQGDGIPYQELEMGQSNSTLAVNTANGGEGWDEGWDDDWDDDQEAIKSEANASVNELQSKAPSKEGWDEDWED